MARIHKSDFLLDSYMDLYTVLAKECKVTKNGRMQESDLLFLTYSRDNDGVKVIVFGGLDAPFSSLLEFFTLLLKTVTLLSHQFLIKNT